MKTGLMTAPLVQKPVRVWTTRPVKTAMRMAMKTGLMTAPLVKNPVRVWVTRAPVTQRTARVGTLMETWTVTAETVAAMMNNTV